MSPQQTISAGKPRTTQKSGHRSERNVLHPTLLICMKNCDLNQDRAKVGEKSLAARVRKANQNSNTFPWAVLIKTDCLSRCGGATRALHEPHESVGKVNTVCNVSIAKDTKKCKSPFVLHCKSLNNDYF